MSRLAERVEALERRIAELERALGSRAPYRQAPPAGSPASAAPPAPAGGALSAEATIGLSVANRIGAAVLLVGAALAAAWAHRHGYLPPALRDALAAATALALAAWGLAGLSASGAGRRTVAAGVTWVGVLGLHVVLLSSVHLDRLLAPTLATGAAAALTAALLWLAHRRPHPALLHLAAASGLATPWLAWTGEASFAPLALWMGGLGAALALVGRARQVGGALALQASVGGAFLCAALPAAVTTAAGALTLALLATAAMAPAVWLLAARAAAGEAAGRADRFAAVSALVAAALAWGLAGDAISQPGLAGAAIALGAAAVAALALALQAKAGDPAAGGTLLAASVWLAAAAPGVADLSADLVALAFAALGGAAGVAGVRTKNPRIAWLAPLLWLVAGALLFRHLDARSLGGAEAAGWLALVAAGLLLSRLSGARTSLRFAGAGAALAAALALASRFAWALTDGGPAHRLLASALWLLLGVALVAAGVRRRLAAPRAAGLVVLALVLGKSVAVDVWHVREGVRVGLFVAVGLGLLAASALYGRLVDRR